MSYEHNYKDNHDGMDMADKFGPTAKHNWSDSPELDLKELPDPDMTGSPSWCESCNKMSEPDGDGKCDCGTKIANVGIKGTSRI